MSDTEWPVPHRFVEHRIQGFCGYEKWSGNPGVFCAEKPGHPLHDYFCDRCGCVVSGAHNDGGES